TPQRRVQRKPGRLRPRRALRRARLDRARGRDLRRRRRRCEGEERRSRPLGRAAQALGGGRAHPPGGPQRLRGARRAQTDLLLRPGPPAEAHRGLGRRAAEPVARRGLAPLRRVGSRLAARRARLRTGGNRAGLHGAARRQIRSCGRPRTFSLVRALILVVPAVALIGCGSSSSAPMASSPAPTPAQTSATPVASKPLPPPSSHRAIRAIPGGVSSAKPFTARSSAAGCPLEGRELNAIVMIDAAPQPYYRLEREVVEFGQNVDWSKVPASAYPRTIKHVGLDANWFPLQNRLLTTDGVRLVTVKLHAPQLGSTERRAVAIKMAGAYLGPLVKPPGY